jgi:hypothetical protein
MSKAAGLRLLVRADADWSARLGTVLVGFFLAWYTWGHWGSVQIDCGRELYVPVTILKGKLLYRDLWYPYGPLAPYVVALLFRVFGVSLTVLYLFGLGLALTTALLAFELGRCFVPTLPAFVVSFFVLIQGFQATLSNYIFGYSYAATMGSLLGLVCLYFCILCLRHGGRLELFIAGLSAGLALSCKQEFGTSCYLLLVLVLTLRILRRPSAYNAALDVLSCVPGVLVAGLVYGWFIWSLSAKFMLLENFVLMPNSYFMRTFGAKWLERFGLRFHSREMLGTMVVDVVVLASWYLVALALRFALAGGRVWREAALAGVLLVLGWWMLRTRLTHVSMSFAAPAFSMLQWVRFPIPDLALPIGVFWLALLMMLRTLPHLTRPASGGRLQAELALAAYALACGIRIMVQVVPFGYGIYYDIPLYVVFVIFLSRTAGSAARGLGHRRHTVRNLICAIEGALVAFLLWPHPQGLPARLTTSLGTIYTYQETARLFPSIVAFMKTEKALGKRILVLPEECILYVLSDSEGPSRWYSVLPGTLSPDDEKEYLRELIAAKVDIILLSNRSTPEHGVPYFGIHYAQPIYDWIVANYRVVGEFGHFDWEHRATAPRGWPPFAMLVYERKTAGGDGDSRGYGGVAWFTHRAADARGSRKATLTGATLEEVRDR